MYVCVFNSIRNTLTLQVIVLILTSYLTFLNKCVFYVYYIKLHLYCIKLLK